MSDIKLFQISDSKVCELEHRAVDVEKRLQSLIERNMETLLGIRFLATEHSTGHKTKGRIDSLGIDENGCPVIVEYKRNISENVINQGLFYLDWLMDHRGEFELLVSKTLGAKAAEEIEWSNPRLLCIARDFNRYDEHAVQQMNRNIELIRYRFYPEGYLLFEMVNASTAETVAPLAATKPGASKKQEYKYISEHLAEAGPDVLELYESIKGYLLSLGDDVLMKTLKFYIAFKRIKNFACVELRPQKKAFLIYAKLNPHEIPEEKGFLRNVRNIGHFGTGDMEITIMSEDDLERAKPLLMRSYEES